MEQRRFFKLQGAGNDFLIFDLRGEAWIPTPEEARRLCDRRFGVGGDGLLLIEEGPRMIVLNADGSRPEMCGNGLRCVARYLMGEAGEGVIETDAGPHRAWVTPEAVELALPAATDEGPEVVEVAGRRFEGRHISTGNPHFILFGDWGEGDVTRYGPLIERHPAFPQGVNVSFATIHAPERATLAVWERGVGATLACGTAAVSTACAGWLEGRLSAPVRLDLPGGALWIDGEVAAPRLKGPATHVFEGVVGIPSR